MCTVTYIPAGNHVYLTSNRDEQRTRSRAIFPYRSGGEDSAVLYPKDGAAGGSWIALKHCGYAGVLLNGAFKLHHREPPYRRSRGLVFLDIIGAASPAGSFEVVDLSGIEPFTIVLYSRGQLIECRWDGVRRYIAELNAGDPHIWSSATLYDPVDVRQRESRLQEWYAARPAIDTQSILAFHRSVVRGEGVPGSVIREEQERVATVSITSIRLAPRKASVTYMDLLEDRQCVEALSIEAKPVSKEGNAALRAQPQTGDRQLSALLRRSLIKLSNWEYWPFPVVYLPVFVYWAWLSLKARSFFFFSTANSSIRNAGFLLESKQQIYDLLPDGTYPRTVYCAKGSPVDNIRQLLAARGLDLPLMAKPDIGQRGLQVKLLRDECDLLVYAGRSRVDFLLQEYIDHRHEVGIFYYRIPGEPHGHISGIVGKEMLSVQGDGRSTIETLLSKKDRYILQLPLLRAIYGSGFLQQVPADGEEHVLAPYGNHRLGAKFLDWTGRITPELEQTIDALCRNIPGFYFGRLDIKFRSWNDLCAGRGFSVIELNGAGSEPTHIYDPAHTIFFAWKEIIRHLRLLYTISRLNARRHKLKPMTLTQGIRMLRNYAKHEKLIAG
jgi:hypothetical protein